jgi:hypothetical protein
MIGEDMFIDWDSIELRETMLSPQKKNEQMNNYTIGKSGVLSTNINSKKHSYPSNNENDKGELEEDFYTKPFDIIEEETEDDLKQFESEIQTKKDEEVKKEMLKKCTSTLSLIKPKVKTISNKELICSTFKLLNKKKKTTEDLIVDKIENERKKLQSEFSKRQQFYQNAFNAKAIKKENKVNKPKKLTLLQPFKLSINKSTKHLKQGHTRINNEKINLKIKEKMNPEKYLLEKKERDLNKKVENYLKMLWKKV